MERLPQRRSPPGRSRRSSVRIGLTLATELGALGHVGLGEASWGRRWSSGRTRSGIASLAPQAVTHVGKRSRCAPQAQARIRTRRSTIRSAWPLEEGSSSAHHGEPGIHGMRARARRSAARKADGLPAGAGALAEAHAWPTCRSTLSCPISTNPRAPSLAPVTRPEVQVPRLALAGAMTSTIREWLRRRPERIHRTEAKAGSAAQPPRWPSSARSGVRRSPSRKGRSRPRRRDCRAPD